MLYESRCTLQRARKNYYGARGIGFTAARQNRGRDTVMIPHCSRRRAVRIKYVEFAAIWVRFVGNSNRREKFPPRPPKRC